MSFYGDQTRWFVGTVVDVNDPLKLDRVRVRVHGVHSSNTVDVPNQDLPWAQVNIPVTEDGSSGLGANCSLKNRAQVFGIFLDGKNSQLPLILGSIPKIELDDNELSEQLDKADSLIDIEITGNTNTEKAFNFFVSEAGGGFSEKQACGMIGNFMVESGANANNGDLNPSARSGFEDENSFGIAQWNPAKAAGNRFGQLVDFANQRNLNYRDIETQLKFVKFELETTPYLGLGKLRKTKTVKEATIVFQDKYERPNKDLAHTNQRVAFANEVYKKLGIGATT